MKKLFLIALLATATTALACGRGGSSDESATDDGSAALAGGRKTRIHFTKNHNQGTGAGQYDTPCIGIITTETIKANKADEIQWMVKTDGGEGNGNDDKCDDLTMTEVNLYFETMVMGTNTLYADEMGRIVGTISSNDDEIEPVNKYYVRIGTTPAGPDPVIVVDCGGCGPPPAGPGE